MDDTAEIGTVSTRSSPTVKRARPYRPLFRPGVRGKSTLTSTDWVAASARGTITATVPDKGAGPRASITASTGWRTVIPLASSPATVTSSRNSRLSSTCNKGFPGVASRFSHAQRPLRVFERLGRHQPLFGHRLQALQTALGVSPFRLGALQIRGQLAVIQHHEHVSGGHDRPFPGPDGLHCGQDLAGKDRLARRDHHARGLHHTRHLANGRDQRLARDDRPFVSGVLVAPFPRPPQVGKERRHHHDRCQTESPHHHRQSSTPAFFKIAIIGHQPVTDDWSRLRPTNAVNHNHWGPYSTLNPTLASTTVPAIARSHAFMSKIIRSEE